MAKSKEDEWAQMLEQRRIGMREVFECIRHGLGYPSIRNDPVLINNGMH